MQAAGASAAAFCVGAGIPLLAAAFIHAYVWRLVSLVRPFARRCEGLFLGSAFGGCRGIGIAYAPCSEAQSVCAEACSAPSSRAWSALRAGSLR